MNKSDELNQIFLNRDELKESKIDINERTIIIGFNEPKFRKSDKTLRNGDVDAKLNARLITHFLPAVELAKMQKNRPRLFIMSAINSALKWNAENEEQKKIMVADNAIKFDFIKSFFEKFFPDVFSIIEYVIPQDILKVKEEKFVELWNLVESNYGGELREVKLQLTKFLYPKKFNVNAFDELSKKQIRELDEVDTSLAFKYAISHLFVLGDINFEGNYIHNKNGYVSIGGEPEMYFNKIRNFAYKVLKNEGKNFFGKDFILFDNMKITLKDKYKIPVPYNGAFDKKKGFLEVTFENSRDLNFYDEDRRFKAQMDYMYSSLVSKNDYQKFWNNYREQYFDLKERYREAYKIKSSW